ncbi:MAG: MGH1-like glycoside hydrolase domain-containing protein [bacterium]
MISQECDFYAAVIPEFHCTDEYIEKTYYYRHYVLRRNLSAPGTGYLKHPVFYEGKQGGYARLITASASLILDECRWWRDPRYGYGHMLNCMENLPYHGIFRDLWVNEIRSLDWPGYEEWISRAMADYLLVHPDQVMAEKVIEAGYHNIQGLLQHKDKNNNYLLNPGGHHMTQEHAPSFTSFDDYRDWYDYTDIERVEFQAFFYGNIVGIARLMQLLGDKRYAELYELAAKIRQAVIASMWDKEDDFFYAVRESDGIKAKCKEANGFLAFLFDLVPYKKPYTNIFRYFIDDRYFWNPYPVSSCAKDVPSYTPHTQMWGNQRKRAGCTWSGPTWPYMNSLLVNVLAGLLRKELSYDITMEHFRNFFQLLTQLHFEDGIPMIREDYDGIDGTPRGCADYLHSTYIDLVVRYALGVDPSRKEISDLQPMLGLDASIEGFPLGGKLWNISIDKSGHCKVVCV